MVFWIKTTFPRMVPLYYEWKSYKTSSKQSFPCCYFLHFVSCETELLNVYKIFGKLPPCGFCVNKYLFCADKGKYINAEYVGICIRKRENAVQVNVSIWVHDFHAVTDCCNRREKSMDRTKQWLMRGQPVQQHETELDSEKNSHVTTEAKDGKQTILIT